MTSLIHCRWMIRRDMSEVCAIAIDHMTGWDEEEFVRGLRERDIIGLVADTQDKVTGNTVYRLGKRSLEILYLAGDPASERALLRHLVRKLWPYNPNAHRRRLTYWIPDWDLERQVFLRSCGFVGKSKGDGIAFTLSTVRESEVQA